MAERWCPLCLQIFGLQHLRPANSFCAAWWHSVWAAASLFLRLHNCLYRAFSLPICQGSEFTPSAAYRGVLCFPPVCLANAYRLSAFLLLTPGTVFLSLASCSFLWPERFTGNWPSSAWVPDPLRAPFCLLALLSSTNVWDRKGYLVTAYVCGGSSFLTKVWVEAPFPIWGRPWHLAT